MRVLSGRRPEFMLLASLLIFVTVLAVRSMTDRSVAQVAVDTSGPAPAPAELSAQETIAKLQDRIRKNPEDIPAYAQLGVALLQRVRETADPTLYAQAQQAFD